MIERTDYVSFLWRLWRENDGDGREPGAAEPVWRATLESSRTGKQWGFAGLHELFAFLRRQTGGVEEDDEGQRKPPV